ncbi:MAG TPA: hypothetical protein VLL25_18530 [Acidimicrobiales bacterium]|nr:hypothetical protein [Acidimicrobiales bacterium]
MTPNADYVSLMNKAADAIEALSRSAYGELRGQGWEEWEDAPESADERTLIAELRQAAGVAPDRSQA